MKAEYPIILIPSDNKPKWWGGARVICFVYAETGNFILKGFHSEVVQWLEKFKPKYLANMSFWGNGETRNNWIFWDKNVTINRKFKLKYINGTTRFKYENKLTLIKRENRPNSWSYPPIAEMKFRRMPNKWIKELNNF